MILNTNKISFWWNFSCEHILLTLYFRAREPQWDESQLFVWLWFSGSKEHRSIMDNGVWSKKALKKIFQTFCVEKVFKSFLHFSESLRSILNYKILLWHIKSYSKYNVLLDISIWELLSADWINNVYCIYVSNMKKRITKPYK